MATRAPSTRAGKPKPPTTYHHGNLRQVLIDATLALIEEGGPEAVTVREAARRAGVSPGAPFRHFPTRTSLMTAVAEANMILAPSRLVSETRVDFRCAALDSLERARESGAPLLAIDMGETRDVDASGLGILVLVQKRARERGITTRLLNTQSSVRSLLTLTKLEPLFEFA